MVRNTYVVQSAFEYMIWIVCAIAIVVAFFALIGTGKTWEEYGKNGLVLERDFRAAPGSASPAALAERDDEIRQLLEARNLRRARRGEAPIDVEQELRRLVTPTTKHVDDALRAEIRELVVARNYRLIRHGKAPLDIQTEVERQIADLPGL